MNTQDILTRINGALSRYSVVDAAEDSRGYNAYSLLSDVRADLTAIAGDLEAQLRREAAASQGTTSATRVITAMLNHQKKRDCRVALHYAWLDKQGRQCACDGFRGYRLNEPLPLEPRPESAGDGINFDAIFPKALEGYSNAPLPSVKELKAHIAVEKAKWTGKRGQCCPLWFFDGGTVAVRADYLLDMMAVFPDAKEIYHGTGIKAMSALYVKSERGDGILMPIRTEAATAAINAAKEAEEARQKAEKDAADRAKFHADVLADMLAKYKASIEADPTYSLTPDQFANLARYAA